MRPTFAAAEARAPLAGPAAELLFEVGLLAASPPGPGVVPLSSAELPVQTVKIDKKFVDACRADSAQPSLLAPIVEFARVAGLETLAEGIEHPEQVESSADSESASARDSISPGRWTPGPWATTSRSWSTPIR